MNFTSRSSLKILWCLGPPGPHAKQEEHQPTLLAECAEFLACGEKESVPRHQQDMRTVTGDGMPCLLLCLLALPPSSEPRLPTMRPGANLSGSLNIGVSFVP